MESIVLTYHMSTETSHSVVKTNTFVKIDRTGGIEYLLLNVEKGQCRLLEEWNQELQIALILIPPCTHRTGVSHFCELETINMEELFSKLSRGS